MTIEDRIDKLAMRQEALIAAIHGLADVVETMRDMQAELMAWLQEPPSTDLADLLQGLAAAVHDNSTVIGELARRIEALPEQLAR
jgi:ABC-type transporter Mla subunit MlaD